MIAEFARSGRRPLNLLLALGIWAVLALAVLVIDLSLPLAALLGLFALPALFDWLTDRQARLTIHEDGLEWTAGTRHVHWPRDQIDHMRLDRRFDFGFRLSVVDTQKRLHRLPPEIAAPPDQLEAALDKAGIAHQRHPFSLIPR